MRPFDTMRIRSNTSLKSIRCEPCSINNYIRSLEWAQKCQKNVVSSAFIHHHDCKKGKGSGICLRFASMQYKTVLKAESLHASMCFCLCFLFVYTRMCACALCVCAYCVQHSVCIAHFHPFACLHFACANVILCKHMHGSVCVRARMCMECICICVCGCVCECVCVCERERESVCVCVCERERERE
jgi:hypothetical protein